MRERERERPERTKLRDHRERGKERGGSFQTDLDMHLRDIPMAKETYVYGVPDRPRHAFKRRADCGGTKQDTKEGTSDHQLCRRSTSGAKKKKT